MAGRSAPRKWSQDVTEHNDALDLKRDVFTLSDPRKIALSLKQSAEASHRRKSSPFRSAMSMLTFYINRAGRGLDDSQREVLERAKDELRALFDRAPKA
ncbi:DUF3175 domain-containing protein [Sphingobium nicotianae]|uniref:DUF3175 domain-containing protein n=1 Tax=Sphingobium nicotianae TaxID=2782607 RepID=A0A9X1DAT3_9SPHN|nr:DUF3175 domain-containing protein [Sphingobium nicotianae]